MYGRCRFTESPEAGSKRREHNIESDFGCLSRRLAHEALQAIPEVDA